MGPPSSLLLRLLALVAVDSMELSYLFFCRHVLFLSDTHFCIEFDTESQIRTLFEELLETHNIEGERLERLLLLKVVQFQ